MASSPPNERAAEAVRRLAARTGVAAVIVAAAAFTLYRATILPGVEFGDGGSIQTIAGSPFLTPRDGYPLYFAIGAGLLKITGVEPAHVMNLASAIEAALACGLFVVVAARLTGSLAAAVASAMLFAVSYTFWSQAVTAEVYALHCICLLAAMFFLLRWQRQPTTPRLAAFFFCYAVGFGNHLSMILLAPAFTLFLLCSAPGGWRSLLAPRVVALAAVAAALGASQYLWNLRTLWFVPDPPESPWAAFRTFWFDVTKSDWRDTMVLNVPQSMLRDHAAMYWFDVRQQFGWPVVVVAAAGALVLGRRHWRLAMLILLIYAVNFAFAFSYNVGDTHVFYLPSHLALALLAGAAVASSKKAAPAAALGLALYAAARGYRDFPALDRSGDLRAASVLEALTAGVDDRRSILLTDLNWQVANGLSYYAKVVAPQVAAGRMRDVLLYAPALIRDNLDNGRSVVLAGSARDLLVGSYGPMFEPRLYLHAQTLDDVIREVPTGTRYVMCVLKPTRDFKLDRAAIQSAVERLSSPGAIVELGDYTVISGVAGETAKLIESSNLPFSRTVQLNGIPVRIRMESWLAADTIRRMGFGHVIVGGRHTLIVERGISFATFDDRGNAIQTAYLSSIFAQPPRYVIDR